MGVNNMGWVAIFSKLSNDIMHWDVFPTLEAVISHDLAPIIVAVDIPIGLLDAAKRGGRDCDIEARKRLGSRRGSSVFPPPVRATLDSDDYAEANVINRASSDVGIGLSKQCYSIIPKIRRKKSGATMANSTTAAPDRLNRNNRHVLSRRKCRARKVEFISPSFTHSVAQSVHAGVGVIPAVPSR